MKELIGQTNEQPKKTDRLNRHPFLTAARGITAALTLATAAGLALPLVTDQDVEAGCAPALETGPFSPWPDNLVDQGTLIWLGTNQQAFGDISDMGSRDVNLGQTTHTTYFKPGSFREVYAEAGLQLWTYTGCNQNEVWKQMNSHMKSAGIGYVSVAELIQTGILDNYHSQKVCAPTAQIGPYSPDPTGQRAPIVLGGDKSTIVQFDIWDSTSRSKDYGTQEVPTILRADLGDKIETTDSKTGLIAQVYPQACLYGAELDLENKRELRHQHDPQRVDQIRAAGLIKYIQYGNWPPDSSFVKSSPNDLIGVKSFK